MKRFLLTICVLALITAIHAQSVVNTPIKRMISQDEVSNVAASTSILTSNTNTAVPTVIWSDNFSSASNWVFTNQSIPSLDWSIETDPMAIPVSVLAPFASATASDGFLFINSDATGGGDNDGTPVIVTATSVQMIDCSSSPYVQISFSHNYRWWHDTRGVRISGDGGVTWNEPNTILYPNGGSITDENNYPSDQNSGNPEITTYDISAFAGGRDSVMVQFYYDDNDYWGWYWAVDDVSISEIPDNGLAIQDEVFGGWWVNYIATGGLGQNYTQYPMNQATANPYAFEAVLKNTGIATQSVTMYADITGPTGMTTSHSSNSISLAVTEQDTFAATTTYTPTMNGVYTIEMWGVADSAGLGAVITNTDITTKTTEVTTDIYGKDLGTQEGYWRLSRTGNYPGGFEVGADYDIYTNDELYAVDVYLTDWSIPGTAIYASLYEIDADPNLDPIPLSVSDDHIISSGEPGSWITIPFLSPQPLLQGTTYSILSLIHISRCRRRG